MIGPKMYKLLQKIRRTKEYTPTEHESSYLDEAHNRKYVSYNTSKEDIYYCLLPSGDDAIAEYKRVTLQISITLLCSILSLAVSVITAYMAWFVNK